MPIACQCPSCRNQKSTTGQIRYICRSRYLEALSELQMHNVTAAARQVRGDIAEI